ncbi:dihydropteroate synthase [Geomicrobium sp. JCM 19039]|uniref:dihydropteroate synthase n=1 Tax=Geomicrobium sp. JCM 19039 TaxID=1460636 RepID=UPI00045F42FE|nr:dihydropteroate synthase [Geomicrobium sp. JCM 19039]GAK13921.1 dihydropteroate synthase [Geomicrobium sp. JCM 19039]
MTPTDAMSWGKWQLDFTKKTLIMGVLNVTPDSFSDGGRYEAVDVAVAQAKAMVTNGADVIDIGGESTRPGFTPVSQVDEIGRVLPVIEALNGEVDVPISIDTYKAETARRAIEAGAAIINDIWGAKYDPEIAKVAAKTGVPIILTHNRQSLEYAHFMDDVIRDLQESVQICVRAGVQTDRIIIDPGIGFAKSYEQNLELMRRLNELTNLGFPILLGTSRKSLIAQTLHTPPEDRLEGTSATIALGIERGCHIVRVHDVKEMARTSKMMDAMLGKGQVNPVG